jgi:hypothetical protein
LSAIEFQIVDRGNQIEAQTKPFPSIPIALTQNAKDFQLANNVLDQNPFSGQGTILSSLLLTQWV